MCAFATVISRLYPVNIATLLFFGPRREICTIDRVQLSTAENQARNPALSFSRAAEEEKKMKSIYCGAAPGAILTAGSTFALAEEPGHEEGHGESQEAHADSHHAHKNTIAAFFGITGKDRRDRAPTLGIDCTRWIKPNIGLGIGVERAFGDADLTVVTVPVSYRHDAWKLYAGPGWEKSDHHDGTESLVRVGIEYEFKREGYEIAPKLMLDFVDGDVVYIGGVAIGWGC